jgi:hypothetical protein
MSFKKMNGTGDHHVKRNKQTLHVLSLMQNLDFFKKGMNIIGGLLDRQWEGERG